MLKSEVSWLKSQNGSYLAHTGDKGMRWGIRRWRNYDGSLTEEGKERYNYYKKKGEDNVPSTMEKNVYSQWDNRGGDSPATKRLRSVSGAAESATKALDTMKVGIRNKDLSQMSNEELRAANERARLESEYAKYYPTQVKSDTRKKVDTFLKVAGTVLALGVTASQIYSNYSTAQQIRNENYDKAAAEARVNTLLKNAGSITVDKINQLSASELSALSKGLGDRNAILTRAAEITKKAAGS